MEEGTYFKEDGRWFQFVGWSDDHPITKIMPENFRPGTDDLVEFESRFGNAALDRWARE